MTRLILIMTAWMSLVSGVSASLSPRPDLRTFAAGVPSVQVPRLAGEVLSPAADRGATPEFVVTEETEILLNGKPCKYADIPAHARIVQMELGIDHKTAVKIHFRTGK